MPFTTETPVFKHDCDACMFIGGLMNDGFRWDVYACLAEIGESIICRYGDRGEEYLSSPVKYAAQTPVMRAAWDLHQEYVEYVTNLANERWVDGEYP